MQKYAKTGYKIASNNEKSLNRALSATEEKIRSTLLEFNSSSCYSPEATALLEGQLSDIERSFMKLSLPSKMILKLFILICLSSLSLCLEGQWQENQH